MAVERWLVRCPFFFSQESRSGLRSTVFALYFTGSAEEAEENFMRIVITGGAGFIGQSLAASLTTAGYEVVILPALENFPSEDVVADTRRINELLEQYVRLAPEQYLWVHRRFKTRPPGSASVYKL